MIFFRVTDDVKITHRDGKVVYEHAFLKSESDADTSRIYFTTESNLIEHSQALKQQLGDKGKEIVKVTPEKLPFNIGFGQMKEEYFEQFKQQPETKVAIINGMSNAIGDHLIGLTAFFYWHDMVSKKIAPSKLSVTFYQIGPHRLMDVTQQCKDKLNQIFLLPSPLNTLLDHHAYVDLSGLIKLPGFSTQPMVDFFLSALSINPAKVPAKKKRNHYEVPPENKANIDRLFETIRTKKRPILMFHPVSTSDIRKINVVKAREMMSQILKKTDYFIVSAASIDYQNKRYIDLNQYSLSTDDFAAIISNVDALLTVDTSSYHLADAFSIPTVVLFTTIKPEYRMKYYPHCTAIMLEHEDGFLFGRHKVSKEPKLKDKQLAYMDEVWSRLDMDLVLSHLQPKDSK